MAEVANPPEANLNQTNVSQQQPPAGHESFEKKL